jgi:hypothetical protein
VVDGVGGGGVGGVEMDVLGGDGSSLFVIVVAVVVRDRPHFRPYERTNGTREVGLNGGW